MLVLAPLLSLHKRLFAPLYFSFLVLILLISFQTGLGIWLDSLHRRIFQMITHSLLIQRETEHLLNTNLDEETSIRGYVLTGDRQFLTAFHRAESDFYTTFYQLHSHLKEKPSERYQLNELRKLHDHWHQDFVLPLLIQDQTTSQQQRISAQFVVDTMRITLESLLVQEAQTLSQNQTYLDGVARIRFTLQMISIISIIGGIAWNVGLLRYRVERPLRRLLKTGELWKQGNMEVRLDFQSTNELGQLADSLDQMATEVLDRQKQSDQRYQCLQDLISGLSHDLRTPLLATRNTLRPMLNGVFGTVNPTWMEILEAYQVSNEELLHLVDALLDVSRYEANGHHNLNFTTIDWDKIVRRVTQNLEQKTLGSASIQTWIDPQLPHVEGDPIELQRVIQNLLDNAVRVSSPDESIQLKVESKLPHWVEISIQDHGPGISAQEQTRLFHRFTQGRGQRGKVGLGLYLCRQIIEAHGGSIGVHSTPEHGSTFWFRLPMCPKDQLPNSPFKSCSSNLD